MELRRNSSNYLAVYVGTVLTVTATEKPILGGVVYLIEAYIKVADSGGRFVVKVDNVTVIDYTGDTKPGADTQVNSIQLATASGGNFYGDDFALDHDNWIGNSRIQGIKADGVGNSAQWNPSVTDIENLSRANPCIVTWTAHGLASGSYVTMSGITQSEWTALNAEHLITYINANSFSIPVNTSGYAAAYVPGTDPGVYKSRNWNCVDETPPSDADYVSTNTVNQVDMHSMANLVGNVVAVKCLQVHARGAYEGVPTPTKMEVGIRTGGVNYYSGDFSPPSSFGLIGSKLWETNPGGTDPFTVDEINAIETGYKSIT